jgi:hypothetical protein
VSEKAKLSASGRPEGSADLGAGRLEVKQGTYHDAILIEDRNPLEDHVEHELLAPGVGFVSGDMIKGGTEPTELVRIERP